MSSQGQAAKTARATPLLDLLEREFDPHSLAETLGTGFDAVPNRLWERALLGPARDFIRRPGKRFRARLVELSWVLGGGSAAGCPPELPLLVEMLHAGSLIVDDIEDESGRRRGADALHRVYGTPLALNTANWLYFWPLVLIGRMVLAPQLALALYRRASLAVLRCHKGQALDLAIRVCDLARSEVPGVVAAATRLKTGGLMELAASLGAVAAGADQGRVAALGEFGSELGVGLQMLDDLSGLLNPDRADKGLEDLRQGRPTWPWAWLAQDLGDMDFARLQAQARQAAADGGAEALARAMAERLSADAKTRVSRHLSRASEQLSAALGESHHLAALEAEIARLLHSYV